ncbi:MAG: peptide chain release factor N(5)-glutamine methyltransferase [Sulfuricella denitrificans]|nr:peptide chain release factor N(5)-glutamine methyltransferase [Sulfuricella denitrificans]
MATLAEVLVQGGQKLGQVQVLDPREARLEAQILLCHALGVARSWLISHDRDVLDEVAKTKYSDFLVRRLAGEPIAYIVGKREFFGLEFKTTPAVLIPRPETELLVELALARIPEYQSCSVLDLGTGSGAIAISIAKNRPQAEVTAVDQSLDALAVARENAERLEVPNLRLLQSNWFSSLEAGMFDLIVSNPPYVEAADPHLQQGDVRFEPLSALASGADGLDDIRHIAALAPAHLEPGGWLLFEHGWNQGESCREILRQNGFQEVEIFRDLAQLERVSLGSWGLEPCGTP